MLNSPVTEANSPATPASSASNTTESLIQQAQQLARGHHQVRFTSRKTGLLANPVLMARVRASEEEIRRCYLHYAQSPKDEVALSYTAEWLLDNFHIIEQTIRQIREDLPTGYYRQLPILINGAGGLLRVFAIASHIVHLFSAELNIEEVQQFVIAYQQEQPLTMGELWALPIMLRIALLEHLTQAITSVNPPEHLTQKGAHTHAPELIADAEAGTRVGNGITALRRLAAHDWMAFFEHVSLVEQTLRDDPAEVYEHMDADTRNRYRHVIEGYARATDVDEQTIAAQAVQLARAGAEDHQGEGQRRFSHVGFFLVDRGRQQLEACIHYRPALGRRLARWFLSRPTLTYLGSITLITLVLISMLALSIANSGGTTAQIVVTAILFLIPASAAAISLVNWMVTLAIPPRTLPRYDFKAGIPAPYRCMVVIPTLITKEDDVDTLAQQLEQHYLRNPDPMLGFALLTDFVDAPQKEMPGDTELIKRARTAIEALNDKYHGDGDAPFYLFHRERCWNPVEECWMGWERKRGKLAEFNHLLRPRNDQQPEPTTFTTQVGALNVLHDIRYVITLDTDTVLPLNAARRLVATLAHPLNQAAFSTHPQPAGDHDAAKPRIVAGYSILQPRTEIQIVPANQSLFTRIYAGDIGLDPYTRAVSDVYQDLFGEGVYVGKGIYDVDAFERSLHHRVPENTLLSHDLFEGIHGRVGLVTDIVLLEDYPPHYPAYTLRQHRWIRGDWQLLPWLMPRVPLANGKYSPNPLSVIDRWKIVDNLRRSLLAPALLAFFMAAWLWLPGSPLLWSLAGALSLAVPVMTSALMTLFGALRRTSTDDMSYNEIRPAVLDAVRWLLALVFLPYEALLALDAIITTLTRLFVTRRGLLQWTTAAHAVQMFGGELTPGSIYQRMGVTLFLIVALVAGLVVLRPASMIGALPFLVAWLISPQIGFWISRPLTHRMTQPDSKQRRQLRCLARRTWLYFEHYVGPDDNWLPPDRYQEAPLGVVAHQTSPTNLGLYLLSILAAYDLGYVRRRDLVARLQASFETMSKLERYRGHFLNWYDTRTLAPLPPAYVSMVDSGNLAACLLALRQACLQLPNGPAMRWERWEGFIDLIEIIKQVVDTAPDDQSSHLRGYLTSLRQSIESVRERPELWGDLLVLLVTQKRPELDALLAEFVEPAHAATAQPDVNVLGDLRVWVDRLSFHLSSMQDEWNLLLPWATALGQAPELLRHADTQSPLGQAWQLFVNTFSPAVLLGDLAQMYQVAQMRLTELHVQLRMTPSATEQRWVAEEWCQQLDDALRRAEATITDVLANLQELTAQADTYVQEMDFRFLFNVEREVFHIGFNLDNSRLDNNFYDLLASEARTGSLVAIAKGDVPVSHWLHLSRPLTRVSGRQALLSWSGTMFEYLMPALLLRSYDGLFLNESCRATIHHQITYAHQRNVPWGISESGYYAFDGGQNYQYRAFGAPGLGYKRGLSDDLVISPYSSLLALTFAPANVLDNLAALNSLQALGRYGYYEAIDYTRSRLPPGEKHAIVKSYLAHHQGMSLVAVTNLLCGNAMVERLHADPRIESVELLLQERIPVRAPIEHPHTAETQATRVAYTPVTISPWEVPAETPWPQAHILSQGRYGVIITNAGAGFSQWQGVALTRWNADPTLEDSGSWIYIQEHRLGDTTLAMDRWALSDVWSATLQPTATLPEQQRVLFHAHKVEFLRTDRGISSHTEVTVAPEDEVEVRRVTLLNNTDQTRHLRLTSYGEVVLAPQSVDQRHPAFNKLFIESVYIDDLNALLFRRRPRSATEKPIYLLHTLVTEPGRPRTGAYESDRARFIGRGQNLRTPAALARGPDWLTGTTGATLDPIMALGQEIVLQPHERAQLAYVTLAATSRQAAIAMARRYQSWHEIDSAFEQAFAQAGIDLRQANLGTPDLERVEQVLSMLLYSQSTRRAAPETLSANEKGQSGLWAYGISGDYPIMLVRLDKEGAPIIRDALRAHAYWRERHVTVNVVFLNEGDTGYNQNLSNYLHRVISATGHAMWLNRRDGLFVIRADNLNEDDRLKRLTSARAVFVGSNGTLAEQLGNLYEQPVWLPPLIPMPDTPTSVGPPPTAPIERPAGLRFDNSLGGFDADGHEYVMHLAPGESTPAPWTNVIANPEFGFLVTETGSSCTWSINSGENRLTPWNNDPVRDETGEAIYLRDEENGEVWSPTPLPIGATTAYVIRHGAGYTIFEHASHELAQHLRIYAAPDAPVKIMQLHLRNTSHRSRRITVTYYAEWVLGTTADAMRPFIVPEYDSEHQTLLTRNPYSAEFGQRVAFATASKPLHGVTADRTEFLGRLGSVRTPAALGRIGLSGSVVAGFDPCAALQVHLDLQPWEEQQIHFVIGQGAHREDALQLAQRFADPAQADIAWQATVQKWDNLLGSVQVHTPDPAMDVLLNRWLLYQAITCRLWGRTAFYQSSGAFGFRDQLQDVMALMHTAPELARAHLIEAAQHQFEAGDVLHWWHPPSGRGIRSRCSDDLLWLPYVTAHYIESTGDRSVLDEQAPFLRGEPLKSEEEERYGQFSPTVETFSLYEHCRRALRKCYALGPHGLPLMGSGDWNDGMNRVGIDGHGESVWLAWFVYGTLMRFAPICELLGDTQQAGAYRSQAQSMQRTVEAAAWDGAWYRRAYYDDGTPLGSATNRECQIDSIAQSWAVLSGAANPQRATQAMQSVNERLVRRADQLVLLFTPPFDKTTRDPGYIRGYVPGIRENGGQYTHAAIWAAWAYAELGQGGNATSLFQMLSPIHHSDTPEKMLQYMVEPYVIAADIYGVPPHIGRGGWTWYTGSASWMYRLGLEAILGLRRTGDGLLISPNIPREWPGFDVEYRYKRTRYLIHVLNHAHVEHGVTGLQMDGHTLSGSLVPLVDDDQQHEVTVHMGD
ncbi:MAG: hypothetical protein M1546_25280 [Chloroflexi bacterium]|nr:hypothetical protein [Chloroflexota bacterium]